MGLSVDIYILILCLCYCVAKVWSLPSIADDRFKSILNSNASFGVLPVSALQNTNDDSSFFSAVDILDEALPTLRKYGIKLYEFNCKNSAAEICKSTEETQSLLLFRQKKFIDSFNVSALSSYVEAQGQILHLLKTSALQHIESVDMWKDLMKTHDGKKNIVLVYSQTLNNDFHDFIVTSAAKLKDRIQFAYVMDWNLIGKLELLDASRSQNKVWVSMCADGMVGDKCATVRLSTSFISASILNRLFAALQKPYVTKVETSLSHVAFNKLVESIKKDKSDTIVITPGSLKQEKALTLSQAACALTIGQAHCLLVKGDAKESKWAPVVKSNRIHLSIIPHETDVKTIDVGYLLSELPEEIHQHWRQLEPLRTEKRIRLGGEEDVSLLDDDLEIPSVFEIQDDPVAHSIHYNKFLHDLHLHDYKSFSRLTDVSYDDVIKSDDFAVILFTLEFNPKSLAAFTHLWLIQKDIKEKTSPLHRVECFDWPDVCAKADVNTYPRMFFYRGAGSERRRTEYTGIWSLDAMKKSIVLHSLPWPVESHETKISMVADEVVYGFASTQCGVNTFRNVANQYGNQYAFRLVQGVDAAESIGLESNVDYRDENTLLACINGDCLYNSRNTFKTASDITSFLSQSFKRNSIAELTVTNYQQYHSSLLPLFVQFKNIKEAEQNAEDGATSSVEELLAVLNKLHASKIFAEKANFVWMDSSHSRPGEYLLHKYSNGINPPVSLAYLSKNRTVSLKSFETMPTEADVKEWIELCLSGNAPVSFEYLDDHTTSRLRGFDYKRYFEVSGMLPTPLEETDYPSTPYNAEDKNAVSNDPRHSRHTEL